MESIWNLKDVLTDKIPKSNKVLVVPHLMPDYDAIGAAMGVVNICKNFGKESYILVNDNYATLYRCMKRVILDISNSYNVINLNDYFKLYNANDLLITTDVSNKQLIAVKDYLSMFKNKIVIDHHIEDENRINTEYKYNNPKISSACEVVATLLRYYDMNYDKLCANLLHAGIRLDTFNYTKKTSASTHIISAELYKNGLDMEYVNDLFKLDFDEDRKVQRLINKTKFLKNTYGITSNDNIIYSREDLSKAADYMLKYDINASFAVGLIADNAVYISSRSNGKLNVAEIMKKLGGGGNSMSAATKIDNTTVEDTVKKLKLVL